MDIKDSQPVRRRDCDREGITSIVATLGPFHDKPWWWKHLEADHGLCPLHYERLVYRGKNSQSIKTVELPVVMLKILWKLIGWRRRYACVFTFECDLVGFCIAFWQSITGMRRPRHVILQFIMREKQSTVRSRAKYALMRFLFSSVYRVVVSSRAEVDYYRHVFGWPEGKAVFVPFHTAPELLVRDGMPEEDYILAAGRTFRDYETLLKAVAGTDLKLVIVGGSGAAAELGSQVNVRVLENIPQIELDMLMRKAQAIVVPLQDRAISIGQSVVLHAMGIGKPVIATRTAGTIDYIDDMVDGILVPPGDSDALRDALKNLEDVSLRRTLGDAARNRVATSGLPHHYSAAVRAAVFHGS